MQTDGKASAERRSADALLQEAERLHRERQLEAAIDVYEEVVQLLDEAGDLPVKPLERIANIQLSGGRVAQAAATLDRLAARAEWLGDHETQARTLLQAAQLHHRSGARAKALDRASRLQVLRDSARLAPETRARIRPLAAGA